MSYAMRLITKEGRSFHYGGEPLETVEEAVKEGQRAWQEVIEKLDGQPNVLIIAIDRETLDKINVDDVWSPEYELQKLLEDLGFNTGEEEEAA